MSKFKSGPQAPAARRLAAATLAAAAFTATAAHGQNIVLAEAPAATARALGQLSIDELAQIDVTSVSKRPEAISHAASSIYVITNDQITRSGALSIPEVLRQAPNLEVMRIDALDYSITARGFAGFESAEKLLVLVDGRSVYTTLYSGVEWDQQNALLDDVERIEVISGPGGTLWGANAVNGVVNITTKSAFDTQGSLAVVNLGTLDRDARVRQGWQIGDSAAARVYGGVFRRGDLDRADGSEGSDGWDGWNAGFRGDWAGDQDQLTLQGEVQDADIPNSINTGAGYARSGNVLGRWVRQIGPGSNYEVQTYYDESRRQARGLRDTMRIWDVSGQRALVLGGRHAVVFGGGYRVTKDNFRTITEPQLLAPTKRKITIGNVFLQDEIALRPDLLLTLGVKLESNSYTRNEFMPNARLGWRISDRQFVWAAVSRAVRNPSRIERDFQIAGLVEPGKMQPETLIAYEIGYRGRMTDAASVSVSAYFHDYDDLRTNELVPGRNPPIFVGNTMTAKIWGLEAWSDVQLADWWRLSLGGALMHKDVDLKPGSHDVALLEGAGADPNYWAKLRSQMKLSEHVNLDVGLRAYDDVPRLRASGYVGTPAYVEASARLAWQVNENLELSVTGLDLLHERHAEASETRRMEIPRSAFVTLRWTR